jgi:mannose-6-phosphate isomerase-like protein (cupin superfamily)
MSGLVVPAGGGRRLTTRAQEVTFKVTGADGSHNSIFEVMVPPGFDVGAHVHGRGQEFFYVLEGTLELLAFEPRQRTTDTWTNWESESGDRAVQVSPGGCMFVPPGVPHAFRNSGTEPVRMLFQSTPAPDHERYFEEIAEIWAAGDSVDPEAIRSMRERYDVTQITPLKFDPPRPPEKPESRS